MLIADRCSDHRTIREIRRDMHKQREWRNELERMKIGNVVGSLSIESKTLRASLVPVTQRTLEQVRLACITSPDLLHCRLSVAESHFTANNSTPATAAEQLSCSEW